MYVNIEYPALFVYPILYPALQLTFRVNFFLSERNVRSVVRRLEQSLVPGITEKSR